MTSQGGWLVALALASAGGAAAQHGAQPIRDRAPLVDAAGTAAYCTDSNGTHVACSDVLYYHHRVLSNPLVWVVFWTAGVDSVTEQQIGGFYTAVTNSEMYDWIIEYDTEFDSNGSNQRIGRGVFGGAYYITPSTSTTAVSDADIQSELEAQMNAGYIPQPDNNTIYMVYFPAGYSISQQNGDLSCSKFCAYHGAFLHGSQDVFYGVFPDLSSGGCQSGCGTQSTTFQNLCSASTHELLEATTDAETGIFDLISFANSLAWYAKPYGAEIGDMCNQYADTITALADGTQYTVQQEYSQNTKLCQTSYHFGTDYRLYASTTAVVAGAGQSVAVPIVSEITGGSPPAHTLSLGGGLAGVTPSFDKTTLAANDSTWLRFSVDGSAVRNSETMYTVTAQQSGAALYTSRTAGVLVRVEPPPGGLTLSGVTDGGTVSGTVALHASATAAAATALDYVALYVDGQLAAYAAPSVSYSWDVSGLAGGSTHTVLAYAVDNDGGNAQVSALVTVVGAPVVQLTAPANGAVVSGSTAVAATAGGAFSAFTLEIDGSQVASASVSPLSYTWNTAASANGSHTLFASATSAGGTGSDSATVTVRNPPVVSIVAPAGGAAVSGTISIAASASAPAGTTLSSLVVSVDGVALGSALVEAVPWDTTTAGNGAHVLTAAATCADGASTTSAGVSVTVANDFTLSLSPASAQLTAGGGAAVFTVSTSAVGGAESVALSVAGLPAGVTSTFGLSTVTAGASTTLTLEAPAGTSAHSAATFTVSGVSASVAGGHTATASLTVLSPGASDAGTTSGDGGTGSAPDGGSRADGGVTTDPNAVSGGCSTGAGWGFGALFGLLPLARRRRG